MEKLISIIVPVYNCEKYLKQCVDSIINQTFSNFELLLIDDGSSDFSPVICKDYQKKDSRILYIRKENEGPSCARNVGIESCKGEYVIFIDSDDYCNTGFLEFLYKRIEETNSDVAIPMKHRCVFFNDQLLSETPYKIEETREQISKDNYFKYSRKSELVEAGKLYRASLVKGARFDPKCTYGEDLLFNYQLAKKGFKPCYAFDAIYYYRVLHNSNSGERRFNTKGWLIVKILANIIRSKEIKQSESLKNLYEEFDRNFNVFYYALARRKKVFKLLCMIQFKPLYFKRHHGFHDLLYMLFPIIIVGRQARKERKIAKR